MKNQYRFLPWLLHGALWLLLWAGPLLSTGAWAQFPATVRWSRTLAQPTANNGDRVLSVNRNGVLIKTGNSLTKLNAQGNEVWQSAPISVTLSPGNVITISEIQAATLLNDGGAVVVGRGLNGQSFFRTTAVARLDATGKLSANTPAVILNYATGNDIFGFKSGIETPDGGFLMNGTVNVGTLPATPVLHKFSASGQSEWVVNYSAQPNNVINAVCNAPNGGYLIAGSYPPAGATPGFLGGFVGRLSETGQSFGVTISSFIFDDVIPNRAGNGYIGTVSDPRVLMAEISLGGFVTVSTFVFPNAGLLSASNFRLAQDIDGSYIVGGTATTGQQGTANDFYIWKVTPGGNLRFAPIWFYKFNQGDDKFSSVGVGSDGSYTVGGTIQNIPGLPNNFLPTQENGYVFNFTIPVTTGLGVTPSYDCNTGQITINTAGGSGNPLEYRIIGLRDWSASNVFTVPPYQQNGTTFTTQTRQGLLTVTAPITTSCTSVVTPPTPTTPTVPSGVFVLRTPDFNCATGKLTALYSNGNGGPVEYRVAGLRDWGTSPDFFVPAHQLTDTTFNLEARLNDGRTATIAFTTGCGTTPPVVTPPTTPTGTTGTLTFAPTTYVCGSGPSGNQLLINLVGINADPANGIEYKIPGLADWQRSNAFAVPRWQANGTTFTLYARRNGNEISTTYTTVCAVSAREGLGETGAPWQAMVMPNPVNEQVTVAITGAMGRTVDLIITDVTGQQLHNRQVRIESDRHEETFGLARQSAGLYLLRVTLADVPPVAGCEDIRTKAEKHGAMPSLSGQSQTVKIIKR
jgi:hypothetical protein